MANDYLIEIDLKTFDESIANCIKQLEKLEKDITKDIGRLTYGAGSIIVREAKHLEGDRTHKLRAGGKLNTGSLARSTHCAPAGVSHGADQKLAESGVVLTGSKGTEAKVTKTEAIVEIGSWMDYAYYVERGTKNMDAIPYLLPAMENKFKESVEYISNGLRKILDSVGRK